MKTITVQCVCHQQEHQVSVKDAGRILVASRKNPNTKEFMKKISKLGVEAKKKKHE